MNELQYSESSLSLNMEREQKVSSIFILKTNAWNIYLTKNEDSSSKKTAKKYSQLLKSFGFHASVALTTTEQACKSSN